VGGLGAIAVMVVAAVLFVGRGAEDPPAVAAADSAADPIGTIIGAAAPDAAGPAAAPADAAPGSTDDTPGAAIAASPASTPGGAATGNQATPGPEPVAETPVLADEGAAPAAGAPLPDLAYGAYQRGLYREALDYALPMAEDGNVAAQTLV